MMLTTALAATAKSNGCRVEGQMDSNGIDVDGVFWSLRNMIEVIVFVCCCPCVFAAAVYVAKAHVCILDALEDCKDALHVRANCPPNHVHSTRACCCSLLSFGIGKSADRHAV